MKTVAIVGRPNVGKSALFNRLTGKEISLVHDRPGVTRDRLVAPCRFDGRAFELVDTGGIGLGDREGFAAAIAQEVEIALETAGEIIFVVDGREGLTPLDQDIARQLRRMGEKREGRRVFVAVNKLDTEALGERADEFHRLGFEGVYPISAAHGLGVQELLETLTEGWPTEEEAAARPEQPLRLAFLGRPNVGKSSLVNALLRDRRTLVSDVAGTTRDSVDVPFRWKNRPFTLIDTAGMRQRRKVSDPLEVKMTGRSAHTINRANVCVLTLDATAGVQMQDKKIGGLIAEAVRPCLIVLNKWDVVQEQGDAGKKREQEYLNALRHDLFFLEYAPVLFTSAKSGERVEHILRAVERIEKAAARAFPPPRSTRRCKRRRNATCPPPWPTAASSSTTPPTSWTTTSPIPCRPSSPSSTAASSSSPPTSATWS